MKNILILAMMTFMLSGQAYTQTEQKGRSEETPEMQQITPTGYTTFKVSDNVTMYRVTFKNQYKMDVAGRVVDVLRLY